MSAIQLVSFAPSENKKELNRFVEFAWTVNSKDPAWVPPLRLTVLDALDTKKNPFYKKAQICLFNAYRNGEQVGRIAAVISQQHISFHNEQVGFWGFFESINDQEVANALFQAAEQWVKAKGMKAIRGPLSPSTNHECGLLINNFERSPYVMMTHNPSYYPTLVEKAGFAKVKDLQAFEMERPKEFNPRISKIAEGAKAKSGLVFRPIDMKNFDKEIDMIQDIYNDAWEKNWGFVPMDNEEFKHMAKSMKDVIWPEFCLIALINNQPIGFCLALPDINQVLKEIPSGKLLPFGIFKLLFGLKPSAKKINRVRVITLGVKQAFRASGVASVFYYESFKVAERMGLWGGECSWILEDNQQMLSAIQAFSGLPPYKTYRIYEKALLN